MGLYIRNKTWNRCINCDLVKGFCTSAKNNKQCNINLHLVLGMRTIGRGFSAANKMCHFLNLPSISKSSYRDCEKKVLNAASAVAEKSMLNAAQKVQILKTGNSSSITASRYYNFWCWGVTSVLWSPLLLEKTSSIRCFLCKPLSQSNFNGQPSLKA